MGDLESKARDENINLPSDIELVLEIVPGDNEVICGYYFVEHGSRCLFWLEEFDAAGICEEIKAVVSLSHLRGSDLYDEVPRCNVLIFRQGTRSSPSTGAY